MKNTPQVDRQDIKNINNIGFDKTEHLVKPLPANRFLRIIDLHFKHDTINFGYAIKTKKYELLNFDPESSSLILFYFAKLDTEMNKNKKPPRGSHANFTGFRTMIKNWRWESCK